LFAGVLHRNCPCRAGPHVLQDGTSSVFPHEPFRVEVVDRGAGTAR